MTNKRVVVCLLIEETLIVHEQSTRGSKCTLCRREVWCMPWNQQEKLICSQCVDGWIKKQEAQGEEVKIGIKGMDYVAATEDIIRDELGGHI